MKTRPPGRALRIIVGLATVMGLAACGSPAAGGPAAGTATPPKDGGAITFLIDSLGDTWIPNNSAISSFQGHIWGHLTDKLVYVDDKGAVSPWVAEKWEQNATATEFTLHLRQGVTFSDKTPLDAAAVVANLDIWSKGDPTRGINPIGLFPKTYDHSQAVDTTTVKVFFKAPTLGFIPTLGYHGSILISPKTIALPSAQQADLSNDIGSGPFVLASWKEGDSVVLKKRPDYNWGPKALGHEGPARLDSITYKLVAEPSVRTSAVQSGQADVAYNPSPQELASFKSQGFTTATPRYLGFVNGFAINTKVAPFDDVKVRQALQHGIDRKEIISTVYTEDWLPAQSLFQSNVPGATDRSADFAYDADKANRLLDEAGWVKGADGVRAKDGKRLEFTLYANPYLAASKSVDELVAQQLGKLGFKTTIQAFDVVTYGERVKINSPSVAAYEVTRSFIDAGTVAGVLTDANKGENWFGLGQTDAKLVQLATGVAAADSVEKRAPLLDELQGHVLQQGYFVPLTQIVQRLYLQSPKLQGVTYNGIAYANYYAAWLG
ncbi:ABC transporter substrate-binding protein [Actinokineospora diospyrosa]|uniref:Peptide/nickel transport system substrate-binding protein n=1 Tax=Actinokineospora diospyrosa TaxID=103728 RepID=A0ABT1IMH8_9PSEU|nr:ABC transporter substrate-binding protein [Actinokineospora diospyrosa]MCP2273866.1 peptide/nickel transport system substrate-binding protein [Actinokineospora diospyrosa]